MPSALVKTDRLHEPVEQEVQIRLMEKLKNHKGHNSMLVLRPADVTETTIAWKMAMENTATPTALIFSRQNITDLPAKGNRYDEALQAEKGAYIVESDENPDVIMVASGSEVSTLEEGAALLRADGIKVRIVSVPSEGLFRSQSKRISGICHSNRKQGIRAYCRSAGQSGRIGGCQR